MTHSEQGQDAALGSKTVPSNAAAFTDLQVFFVERLAWLLKQRRECVNVLSPGHWQMRLIHKALYSTYRDCVETGVEDSANELFEKERHSN
jgi:hypothetical protein